MQWAGVELSAVVAALVQAGAHPDRVRTGTIMPDRALPGVRCCQHALHHITAKPSAQQAAQIKLPSQRCKQWGPECAGTPKNGEEVVRYTLVKLLALCCCCPCRRGRDGGPLWLWEGGWRDGQGEG